MFCEDYKLNRDRMGKEINIGEGDLNLSESLNNKRPKKDVNDSGMTKKEVRLFLRHNIYLSERLDEALSINEDIEFTINHCFMDLKNEMLLKPVGVDVEKLFSSFLENCVDTIQRLQSSNLTNQQSRWNLYCQRQKLLNDKKKSHLQEEFLPSPAAFGMAISQVMSSGVPATKEEMEAASKK
jgi:hypothetical protein